MSRFPGSNPITDLVAAETRIAELVEQLRATEAVRDRWHHLLTDSADARWAARWKHFARCLSRDLSMAEASNNAMFDAGRSRERGEVVSWLHDAYSNESPGGPLYGLCDSRSAGKIAARCIEAGEHLVEDEP